MLKLLSLVVLLVSVIGCNSSGASLETDRPGINTGIVWHIKAPNPFFQKMVMKLGNTIVFNSCAPTNMANVTFTENRTMLNINNMHDPAGANVSMKLINRDINCSNTEIVVYNGSIRHSVRDVNGIRHIDFNLASP